MTAYHFFPHILIFLVSRILLSCSENLKVGDLILSEMYFFSRTFHTLI